VELDVNDRIVDLTKLRDRVERFRWVSLTLRSLSRRERDEKSPFSPLEKGLG
jgi:hypothetical protein